MIPECLIKGLRVRLWRTVLGATGTRHVAKIDALEDAKG